MGPEVLVNLTALALKKKTPGFDSPDATLGRRADKSETT